ncbi:MAG TPA: malate synthase A [Mycobacteriales bacterium]|jgi:malate synthase|nr:malate synthase A [Mycobacteriales bacterium]
MPGSDAKVTGTSEARFEEVLTPSAMAFVADLQRRFGPRRTELLAKRRDRRAQAASTGRLDFLDETKEIREDTSWRVAPPADLVDRRVEITGPTEKKMLVNALNSGAKVFMADFEDASTPTWHNKVQGQINLIDAIERRIDFETEEGKAYKLNETVAALMPRPRGWHLPEKHVLVDDEPISGGLFDFGLCFFHNHERLAVRGTRPYFYLPKMESHLEARLWNDVFNHAQDALGVERGTIRATVLIETIPAAFEMDEILYELREHSYGLNAGRWDYMFSMIKTFRDRGEEYLLPDRNSVTMTVPFMRSYTELLVQTCHKRGAFAMGGMAAFIPSRKDPEINRVALEKVKADKEREAAAGFDGTWVAHPDLVETAMKEFDAVLGDRPNQIDKLRPDVDVSADDLLAASETPGERTSAGLRTNVDVGIRYLESWLRGNGAAAIHNLMEDAATAEISRSQVWQWVHNDVTLADTGDQVTAELVRKVADEVTAEVRSEIGDDGYEAGRWAEAREVFESVALDDDFVDFLTLPAYDRL